MGNRENAAPFADLMGQLPFEADFDPDDFKFIDPHDMGMDDGQPQERIMQPRIDAASLTQTVSFANACEFARQIDLSGKTRTFAWVSGSFVFGDLLEALMTERGVSPEELYICSLSISRENIDSLHTIMRYGRIRKARSDPERVFLFTRKVQPRPVHLRAAGLRRRPHADRLR